MPYPSDELRVDTPEQVALELPLAGIGSRALALAIDTLLQVLLYLLALLLLTGVRLVVGPGYLDALGGWLAVVLVLFTFCLFWGYFAFFESVWAGQTPGKRAIHIRVIKSSGRPVNSLEAIARNLLRAIDFLPSIYATGLLCMLIDRRHRRLGDLVAGTVVVHERLTGAMLQAAVPTGTQRESGDVTADVAHLARADLVLIETYLQRRAELDPEVRVRMRSEIAARVRARANMPDDAAGSDDDFLEAVARRIRENARF
jgi:uncharacterized RDD family membrane protein YckC